MKTLILSMLVLSIASVSNAQNVNIPDANFKSALISAGVDTNEDSLISYAEAETVTYLDISNTISLSEIGDTEVPVGKIESLAGIEAFVNLDTLICSGNNIDRLSCYMKDLI